MQDNYKTERLELNKLSPDDVDFIFELVNTPGWLKFIGDRNVRTKEDAAGYIQKILGLPGIHYRVVKLAAEQVPVGVVTFIQRDYLEHPDIGFAFLPQYAKQGYAFEASREVLHDLCSADKNPVVLATTIKDNTASIQLLTKLGFGFRNEIRIGADTLHVYTITADRLNKAQ